MMNVPLICTFSLVSFDLKTKDRLKHCKRSFIQGTRSPIERRRGEAYIGYKRGTFP